MKGTVPFVLMVIDVCSFPTNFKGKDLLGLPMEIFFVKFRRPDGFL
ncbi:hypothetical protein [Thermoanaerobacter kivui]